MHTYIGEVNVMFKGEVYQNNSIIRFEDIGSRFFVNGIYCLTNKFPCCTNGEGSWYYPDNSQLDNRCLIIEGSFYQCNSSRQALILLHSESANFPSGIFHCEIPDNNDIQRNLYIGIYKDGFGNDTLNSYYCIVVTCNVIFRCPNC